MSTTPCNECSVPVDSEVHAEELGLCLDCSNAYFTTDCQICGNFIAGGNPFSTRCDDCLEEA
jgi:hypothetical protein